MKTIIKFAYWNLFLNFIIPFLGVFNSNLILAQSQSGYACVNYENLDRFLTTTVYVNFHFILDGNGEGNFRASDDGNGNSSVTGKTIAYSLLDDANNTLSNLVQNWSKKCNGDANGFVPDAKLKFEIYYDQNDPDQGIHYRSDQNLYDSERFDLNVLPGAMKAAYSIYGDKVIDIFMFAKNASACNVWGEAAPYSANLWCLWHYY